MAKMINCRWYQLSVKITLITLRRVLFISIVLLPLLLFLYLFIGYVRGFVLSHAEFNNPPIGNRWNASRAHFIWIIKFMQINVIENTWDSHERLIHFIKWKIQCNLIWAKCFNTAFLFHSSNGFYAFIDVCLCVWLVGWCVSSQSN